MRDLTEDEIDYLGSLGTRAAMKCQGAMNKFPQPNYVLTKIAEEAGEVVKAGVHYAEGRDYSWQDIEDECVDTIAMCFRLLIEGDAVHGIRPPENAILFSDAGLCSGDAAPEV